MVITTVLSRASISFHFRYKRYAPASGALSAAIQQKKRQLAVFIKSVNAALAIQSYFG
tara:strand:- start:655 stop:828 length:174 start_codon:yes stop_codon:yes gene_type:complete